ncbi:MAG: Gfo/Idh/MocA family oxidoreductase [Dehalococcoidia bacterium]|nr:Gfo/Idh/MocA family oxidoreductase [Dehalococcoidia bacterium]
MKDLDIRVGLIGAGGNVRNRHIPGFQKVDGLEIVAVANRSVESGRAIADQFDIPRVYGSWRELLEDDDINAVCIGTWPYMHKTMTIAALESGKHVLTEARMANTTEEAKAMLEASRKHPDLVCQLTPTSTTYKIDRIIQRLVREGFLGELLSVEVQALQNRFADLGGDLHWRHDRELSGYNTLNIGAAYESMMRWFGRGTNVMAMSKIHVPYRRNSKGELVSVSIPDHVDILYELANNAQVHMRMSATTGHSTGNQMWFYGTEGTIYIDQQQNVFGGRLDEDGLSEIANPLESQAYYRVEEEFSNAIRGVEQITMVSFETGVHYIEWSEAVSRSAQTRKMVTLPL